MCDKKRKMRNRCNRLLHSVTIIVDIKIITTMTEQTALLPAADAERSSVADAVAPSSSSPVATTAAAASSAADATSTEATRQHKHIEQHLNSLLTSLQQRQPLDVSYDSLIPVAFRKHAKACSSIPKSTGQNKKSNALPADVKLYRRLNANLRDTVETYGSTPAGWRRRPNTRRIDIDFGSSAANANEDDGNSNDAEVDAKLRAAFALRESKEHEQRDLVNATLKAENVKLRRGWGFCLGEGGAAAAGQQFAGLLPPLEDAITRKKRLEVISKQLKDEEKGADERKKWKKIAKKGRGLVSNLRQFYSYSLLCIMLLITGVVLLKDIEPKICGSTNY